MRNIDYRFKRLPLSELKPHPENNRYAKQEDLEELRRSLKKGDNGVIVLDNDHTILGGHHRFQIMKEEGWTHADCKVAQVKLTPKEQQSVMLDNNINVASYDKESIANSNFWDISSMTRLQLENTGIDLDLAPPEEFSPDLPDQSETKNKLKCPSCGVVFDSKDGKL